jgi:hypothetical protein
VPVPLSDTVCATIGDAKLTVSVAVTWPAAVGANLTLKEQLLFEPIFFTQLFPAVKGDVAGGFTFVIVTLVTVTDVVPVFFTVTLVAALVVPTNWLPKFMVVGVTVTPCACTSGVEPKARRATTGMALNQVPIFFMTPPRLESGGTQIRIIKNCCST